MLENKLTLGRFEAADRLGHKLMSIDIRLNINEAHYFGWILHLSWTYQTPWTKPVQIRNKDGHVRDWFIFESTVHFDPC